MYDGTPSIRLEGDRTRALALIPDAKALLQRAQAFVKTADVPTYSLSASPGPGQYIFVLVSNGLSVITISVDPVAVDEEIKEIEPEEGQPGVAYYSGCVVDSGLIVNVPNGLNTKSVLRSFAPTIDCRLANPSLRRGKQDFSPLSIKPWAAYTELESKYPTQVNSQYTKLRPSMYSGTMKKVVQAVMGLGRVPKRAFVNKDRPNAPLPRYADEIIPTGVQVRYDYKFHRTHGIFKAEDGVLWLVEVSMTQGVLARPLPTFPASSTPLFKRRGGEQAINTIIDELGGIPTGEAFPVGADLADALRDGTILRLAGPDLLKDFYAASPYTTTMGWAFNDSGNEAHNTAWYFHEDGFIRSIWWAVRIDIGPLRSNRLPGEPIAFGSASARLQKQGYLYSYPAPVPSSPARYLPMKFYEPAISGMYSFSAVPTEEARGKPQPKCDTVMYVTFIDNRIRTVSYFNDPRSGAYSYSENNTPDCPYGDAWTNYSVSGNRTLTSGMYTNDIDDRRVLQENTSQTSVTSQFIGHDPPTFGDLFYYPDYCYMTRDAVFKRETTTIVTGGEAVLSVVAIPGFSREAYYYAKAHWYSEGFSRTKTITYDLVQDPHAYYGHRKFGGFIINPTGCNKDKCGGQHSIRKVICEDFNGGGCSDYADGGGWANECDDIEALCRTPPRPRRGSTEVDNRGTNATASVTLMCTGGNGPINIPTPFSEVTNQWTAVTPDPITGIAQILTATHSALGADAVLYDTGLGGGTALRGTLPEGVRPDGIYCFIGVNGL